MGERFRARAAAAGRTLVVDGGADLTVKGDRFRLEQALTSMVDNAMRHGEGEVRLWGAENDRGVRLHVGDRGAGFPPEFVARAFERFSRADTARGRGGSGLGLAIVRRLPWRTAAARGLLTARRVVLTSGSRSRRLDHRGRRHQLFHRHFIRPP